MTVAFLVGCVQPGVADDRLAGEALDAEYEATGTDVCGEYPITRVCSHIRPDQLGIWPGWTRFTQNGAPSPIQSFQYRITGTTGYEDATSSYEFLLTGRVVGAETIAASSWRQAGTDPESAHAADAERVDVVVLADRVETSLVVVRDDRDGGVPGKTAAMDLWFPPSPYQTGFRFSKARVAEDGSTGTYEYHVSRDMAVDAENGPQSDGLVTYSPTMSGLLDYEGPLWWGLDAMGGLFSVSGPRFGLERLRQAPAPGETVSIVTGNATGVEVEVGGQGWYAVAASIQIGSFYENVTFVPTLPLPIERERSGLARGRGDFWRAELVDVTYA
jgi:hypothetical protein